VTLTRQEFCDAYVRRRLASVKALSDAGLAAAIFTLGAEMPWMTGYQAMPLERITALVLSSSGEAVLFVPSLEAPRVRELEGITVQGWVDGEDPYDLIVKMLPAHGVIGVSDRSWSRWLLEIMRRRPELSVVSATELLTPLRRLKDPLEVTLLEAAGASADRVARRLQAGDFAVIGKKERELSREIADALIEEGHERASFSIVASGPNAASPHHEPGERVISVGDSLVCDFGGVFSVGGEPGYCSDTTRTFFVGDVSSDFQRLFDVLYSAQDEAVKRVGPGMTGQQADAIARSVIDEGGYGKYFIHRLGHGIGLEEHENPYLSPDSETILAVGDAFSVEPGIYIPQTMGARIEDIVICEETGVRRLNQSPRELTVLTS